MTHCKPLPASNAVAGTLHTPRKKPRQAARPWPVALGLALLLGATAGWAAGAVARFVDEAAGLHYDYPAHMALDPEFQGSSTMVGVSDSSVEKGDISFRIVVGEPFAPPAASQDPEALAQGLQTQAQKVLPRSRLVRSSATRLLGAPAAEVVFHHRPLGAYGGVSVLQLVGAVIDGKAYVLRCEYPQTRAGDYAPVCESIRASAARR